MPHPTLEERVGIEDLYARYTWALDTGDTAQFAACFTEDALISEVQPDGAVTHTPALPFLEARLAREPDLLHQHWTGSLLFEPHPSPPSNHWQIKLYVFATLADPNDPKTPYHPSARVTWSGYTIDTVANTNDKWRFTNRSISPWTGTLKKPAEP